jgi:NACalpha-BTF3-like transcription factor
MENQENLDKKIEEIKRKRKILFKVEDNKLVLENPQIITLGKNNNGKDTFKGVRLPNEIVEHFSSEQLGDFVWVHVYDENGKLVTSFKKKLVLKTQKVGDKKYYYIYVGIPKSIYLALQEYEKEGKKLKFEIIFKKLI